MSYITFDYKCTECDRIDTRMVKRDRMDKQICDMTSVTFPCLGLMVKLPAGTRTTFLFADTKLK